MTFEYEENAPSGKSIKSEQIVMNYLELQRRIKQKRFGPV